MMVLISVFEDSVLVDVPPKSINCSSFLAVDRWTCIYDARVKSNRVRLCSTSCWRADARRVFGNRENRVSFKMMQFEEEGETLKDKSRCANVRADLKMCLLQSDCCKIYKRTPRECLRSYDGTVPNECFALRNTFFECKHSLIDGRRRFRGPKGY